MDKPTDVSGLVKLVEEEIARRGLLPENHAADRSDDSIDSDVSNEWLLIECDVPDCNEFTEVDLIAADPVHDDPPLRAVLGDRGWSSDAEGRDLCPKHPPGIGKK